MSDPREYQFDLREQDRPDRAPLGTEKYPNLETDVRRRSSVRRFHPVEGIRAVVIHATAGWSSADAVGAMKTRKASFHFLVPDEDEPQHGHFSWEVVPPELAAWHVRNQCSHADVFGGRRLVNHWSIGVEIVNTQKSADAFSAWQIEAAAGIVRWCWMKFPNLKHVVSHAKLDPERRSDPGEHFPWREFEHAVIHSAEPDVPELVALAPEPSCDSPIALCHV
jgi:N-acetylmuramoyl-L-alanine amidase